MADFTKRGPGCDDDCEGERGERGKHGERGERGERGKRGQRGHDGERGHDGRDGDTGPTGPTGSTGLTGATGVTGPAPTLQDDSVPVPGTHDTLNFIGAGVQVTDAGGGVANITISGSNLVFRPGGVQGGNVYTSWADLVAAAQLVEGFKTIQIDNSIVSPAVIPPGVWDMTDVELTAYFPGSTGALVAATIADGASFTNLRTIGGALILTNLNSVNAPVVIAPAPGFAAIFEMGLGSTGDFPTIINASSAPFFDLTGLLAGQTFLLRLQGVVTGTALAAPAIQLGAAPAGNFAVTLYDSARIHANMVGGTDPASRFGIFQVGTGGQVNRQASFAGSITYGQPNTAAIGGQVPWTRFWIFPASVNQGPTAPLPGPAAFTPANGLGMNTVLRLAPGVADVAQVLPLIRAAAPTTGAAANTPGVLESAGLVVVIKNEGPGGSGDVVISGDPTTPDTIDGSLAAVVVPPGGARIFVSDGVSNWTLIGGI